MPDRSAHPRVLADVRWLSRHLHDPRIVVVEVDQQPEQCYLRGHVPGAVLWRLLEDLEDRASRDVLPPAAFADLMSRSGISNGTTVVLYGDQKNRSATWAFRLLKYYRHRDARILNGGRQAWVEAGLPLSTDVPKHRDTRYDVPTLAPGLRATRDHILSRLRAPDFLPLDVRSREEFQGIDHPDHPQTGIQRLGHLPGAVHLEWDKATSPDGTFLPAEVLRETYARLGVTPDKEIVTYCRLGVRASYSWFVLKYLLRYPRVRNYDGSWTEWGNLIGAPTER